MKAYHSNSFCPKAAIALVTKYRDQSNRLQRTTEKIQTQKNSLREKDKLQLKDTLLKCLIDCIIRERARIEKQERYKETFKDSDTGAKGDRERGRQIERG